MMPGELVKDGRGLLVEAFLVEMRSISGFSGSPVFVVMPGGSDRGNGTIIPFHQPSSFSSALTLDIPASRDTFSTA